MRRSGAKMKAVAFYTLGCKVNQYETAALASLFARRGYRIVEDFESIADVYVINTCTVTGTADQKSRQAIRRAIRRNPEAVVVVTGCYAQVNPEAVAGIPGVDVVVGTFGREGLVDLVEEAMRTGRQVVAVREFPAGCKFEELPALFTTRTRAYLKIQEGCRDFCTFCLVPYARGPLRSRKPEAVLAEARRLLAAGFKEVVLTGIHIGLYGCDLQPPVTLAELVARVLELPGIERLRLSSLEPTEVTPELVALIARDSRFCPHLHIPLQSGDDGVLRRMGRRYTTAAYAETVHFLRAKVPEIAITTDVMVGFPGETDAAFARSVAFVRQIGFAGLHVFKFSPRPGTPAATFADQVPGPVKEKRLGVLLEVGAALSHTFAARFSGRTVNVLVEGKNEAGFWEGLSEHYLPVAFTAGGDLRGLIVPVRVREVKGKLLCGELLTEYS
ncbi:tRNA (N(6)-L-threonylcarbamoyladenosine(37)-C(2))-methylthiotransferase MtaB [Thermodesulfitimonas autotrophica]|nr:tRNA (N(6)-L-threonylcarbamoyladenosine(37)-C(2))-methylthiotransferase MtaB [Thermodesulfitimonas autotrophica]